MKPIFLIGFMGCGKSTLGRALSAASGKQFIDLDNYIEQRFHSNIRDIFATRGEDGFRDLERRMLEEVSEFEDVIVACGGGTPCFFNNMERMNSTGLTIWLTATDDTLLRRLRLGRLRRPLIANMNDDELCAYISEALTKREPYYSQAASQFSGDKLENRAEIDATVALFMQQYGLASS